MNSHGKRIGNPDPHPMLCSANLYFFYCSNIITRLPMKSSMEQVSPTRRNKEMGTGGV
jgi:hypothetical protein